MASMLHSGCSIFLFAFAFAGSTNAALSVDETLDAGAAAFYAPAPTHGDHNNASIGLMGLGAPVGQDFMAYGRALAAQPIPLTLAEAQKRSEVPNALKLKWDQQRMECWTDDYEPFDKDPKCVTIEEAIQTLRDNAELLKRYRLVQKLPAASGFIQAGGVRSVEMAKLTAIEIKVALRQGRTEEAYRTWADHYAFWRRMNSTDRTWVEVAIGLVNEGISLGTLESLLFHSPQLIDKHYDELVSLLTPENIARYNFPGIMRTEYALAMGAYKADKNKAAILPNYITNRHYRYAQQILEVAEKPASELSEIGAKPCKCLKPIELNSSDPRFAASAEFIGPSVHLGTFELIKSMHAKNRLMNLLTMRIRISKDKVRDAEVESYLSANAANIREPFTNGPMQWDAGKRLLYYDNPNYKGASEVRL